MLIKIIFIMIFINLLTGFIINYVFHELSNKLLYIMYIVNIVTIVIYIPLLIYFINNGVYTIENLFISLALLHTLFYVTKRA